MRERQLPTRTNGDGGDSKPPLNVKSLLVGGIGGLTPLVVTVALADAGTLANYLERSVQDPGAIFGVVGYAVKAGLLFAIGAFWVWLQKSDISVSRAFQLGLVAPGMIMVMMNADNLHVSRESSLTSDHGAISIIGTAYAQSSVKEKISSEDAVLSPSDWFIKGLLGR